MSRKPYFIGIAGPSGAGKSYLAQAISQRLKAPVLELDRYYRDLSHLPMGERMLCNFDDPAALEHELLLDQVLVLRENNVVLAPAYDFSTHTRSLGSSLFLPAPYIILEGLFILHWPQLRELLDTVVYVDAPEEVCLQRRIERDVRDRGRTAESVIEQFRATVALMAENYVRPTLTHAQIMVSGELPIDEVADGVLEHLKRNSSGAATGPSRDRRVLHGVTPSVVP
jgi:uridine kinase